MSSERWVVGRVVSRQDGTVRLVDGQIVVVEKCPCDHGKLMLLKLLAAEYQPVLWEV